MNHITCTGLAETECRQNRDICKWKGGSSRGRGGYQSRAEACYGKIICEDLDVSTCGDQFKCTWDQTTSACASRGCEDFTATRDCGLVDKCYWDDTTNACATKQCSDATDHHTCKKLNGVAGCRWSKT